MTEREPPRAIWYSLEEALELLGALEDARDALIDAGHLPVVVGIEPRSEASAVSSNWTNPEDVMATEALRATEAARRLSMPTKELLRLIRDRQIRFVMVDGIAHVPEDAVEEYRQKVS